MTCWTLLILYCKPISIMTEQSQQTIWVIWERCQQSLTASSIVSQRNSREQLSTQSISDSAQLNDDDADITETTIMNLSETVTASEQQEAVPQTTEDLIVKIKKTSLIILLNTETHRVCNLARHDKLRQRLIDQQLKQEIEDLKRQVKERAQKQNYRAWHDKFSLSHHMQETSLKSLNNDNLTDNDFVPNSMAGQCHGQTESDDMMLANDRLTKKWEHWKLKNSPEYWKNSWVKLQTYIEQAETHFDMKS